MSSYPGLRRLPRTAKAPRPDTPGRSPSRVPRRWKPLKPLAPPAPPRVPGKVPRIPMGVRRIWGPPVETGPFAGGKLGPSSPGIRFPGSAGTWGAVFMMAPFAYQQFYTPKNPRWKGIPNLPDPGYWALKHGYNDPVKYYSPSYWGGPEYLSTNAYGSTGTGPGTGLISGQSVSILAPVPGTYSGTGTNLGWWVKNDTLARYAQTAAFIKRATLQNPNYAEQLRMQLGPDYMPIPSRPGVPSLPDVMVRGEPGIGDPVYGDPLASVYPDTALSLKSVPSAYGAPSAAAPPVFPSLTMQPGHKPAWSPAPHVRKPPGKGEHEAKGKTRPTDGVHALNAMRKVLGSWSEFNDAVKSMHDALPERYQAHSYYKGKPIAPSWEKQWKAVTRNLNKVDLDKALTNQIADHTRDKVRGKMSKAAAKALPQLPNGLTIGRF